MDHDGKAIVMFVDLVCGVGRVCDELGYGLGCVTIPGLHGGLCDFEPECAECALEAGGVV